MSCYKYNEFKIGNSNVSIDIKDETTASKVNSDSKLSTDDSFIDVPNYIYKTPSKKERAQYFPSTPRKEKKFLISCNTKIKGKNLLELFEAV